MLKLTFIHCRGQVVQSTFMLTTDACQFKIHYYDYCVHLYMYNAEAMQFLSSEGGVLIKLWNAPLSPWLFLNTQGPN